MEPVSSWTILPPAPGRVTCRRLSNDPGIAVRARITSEWLNGCSGIRPVSWRRTYVDTQTIIVPGPGRGTRMVHSGFRFPSADDEPARARVGPQRISSLRLACRVRACTARAPLTARRYGQSAERVCVVLLCGINITEVFLTNVKGGVSYTILM